MPQSRLPLWKSSRSSFFFKCLLLCILPLLAHFPVTAPEALIDDREFYIDDPVMEASDGLQRIWFHPLDNDTWPYIPITRSSFWLERQWGGLDLRLSHGVNLLLHLSTALLLWLALQQYHLKGAWLIALLFALHPVHVQSVAWIVERKNMVAGLFYVLTFWSYALFAQKPTWRWYGLTLLLFLAALLSKTSTIMLPFLLIFCRLWMQEQWKQGGFGHLIPFFLLSLGSGLLRIWFESRSFQTSDALTPYALPLLERLLLAGHIPFFYLSKLVFPYPLIFTYPRWTIDAQHISMFLPLLSVGVVALLLLMKYQSWGRPWFLGLGAFIVTLFPVLGFINTGWQRFSFVSDHWVHLASLPIFILIVQGLLWGYRMMHRKNAKLAPWSLTALWSCLFLVLSILTWRQTRLYQNEATLWSATVAKNPTSWVAYHYLGNVQLDQGNPQLALEWFDQEIHYNAKHPEAFANRGVAYFRLQQYDQAIENLNQAIQLNAKDARFFRDRGLIYFHLNQFPQMCADWKHACLLGDCGNFHLAQKKRDCL